MSRDDHPAGRHGHVQVRYHAYPDAPPRRQGKGVSEMLDRLEKWLHHRKQEGRTARRLFGLLAAFAYGYRLHMAGPKVIGRFHAVRVGLHVTRDYLHNTSKRWPRCGCELHRGGGVSGFWVGAFTAWAVLFGYLAIDASLGRDRPLFYTFAAVSTLAFVVLARAFYEAAGS